MPGGMSSPWSPAEELPFWALTTAHRHQQRRDPEAKRRNVVEASWPRIFCLRERTSVISTEDPKNCARGS